MRIGTYLMAAAAATMAVAPAVAAPVNPAASLSVSKSVRTASVSGKKNQLRGGGVFVAVIALIIVVVGIVIVAKEDSSPDSP